MRKIILHIGSPKTGTTSIQKFLHLNYETLAELDRTIYPMTGRKDSDNIIRYSHNLLLPSITAHKGNTQALLASINKEAIEQKQIIISAELFFSKLFRPAVQRSLKTIKNTFRSDEVKILIYLRRWDLYLESVYNQAVKQWLTNVSIDKYIEQREKAIGWHPADYLRYIAVLENIFGKDAIEIRSFDKQAFIGGDLYKDFCHATDLQHIEHYKKPKKSNESLTTTQLLATILLAPLFNKKDNAFVVGKIKKHLKAQHKSYSEFCLFSNESRQAIINRFENDEHKLRTYMKKPDSFLFDSKAFNDKSSLPPVEFSFEELKALRDSVLILGKLP